MPRTVIVVLGTTSMEVTPSPTASNAKELLPKDQIVGVYPVKRNVKPRNGEVTYSLPSGNFVLGETITGGTSGATAVIQAFKGTTVFLLTSLTGTFVDGETITGGTSAKTATVEGASRKTSYDGEWTYPFPTMTIIEVLMHDGRRFNIELQEITNQATWNLGTLAAQQAAINDINAWL